MGEIPTKVTLDGVTWTRGENGWSPDAAGWEQRATFSTHDDWVDHCHDRALDRIAELEQSTQPRCTASAGGRGGRCDTPATHERLVRFTPVRGAAREYWQPRCEKHAKRGTLRAIG